MGDNLELDAIAANNAGLIGVWLNRRSKNSEAYFSIIKQINSLNDLLKLLDR
ncbi:hypothetical protein [Aulosira sp. FACHB-615]|uniref:hypothetical protein n=1 Tax=Aulosira sp. FACHB-615 TaxID=2692777 RepID=UPI001688DDDA|nr:hypothetical protein [Aulosira sp. FACHB-615]